MKKLLVALLIACAAQGSFLQGESRHPFLDLVEDSVLPRECAENSQTLLYRGQVGEECDFLNQLLQERTKESNYLGKDNKFFPFYTGWYFDMPLAGTPLQEESIMVSKALDGILPKGSDKEKEFRKFWDHAFALEKACEARIEVARQREQAGK